MDKRVGAPASTRAARTTDKQVIATTHSDLITSGADTEGIIVMRRHEGTDLWQGHKCTSDEDVAEALQGLGVPAAAYSWLRRLGARVVVAVEGPTEAHSGKGLAAAMK